MKNQKRWKKALSFTFALAVTASAISSNTSGLLNKNRITASAAVTDETITAIGDNSKSSDKAVRTIMLYLCGADLETQQESATISLKQILSSDFGSDEDVHFIVMTGGSSQWKTDSQYLYDPATGTSPEEISNVYNQIWEAKGIADDNNPGQLVLLDGDGISGDGENSKTSFDEPMCDPETLKAFINYSAENFPAEKYDLILWDHGGGPSGGFGQDEHIDSNDDMMSFAGLIDAFSDNAVTENGGKFDIINFDACLMSSLDLVLAFADYADYYIASPETIPGLSQEYTGWLNAVGENPEIDSFELGKIITDDMIAFYEDENCPCYGDKATLAVIDNKKLLESDIVSAMSDYTELLKKGLTQPNNSGEYYFYDELFAWGSALKYGTLSYNYYDLGVVMNILSGNFINFVDGNDITTYTETAERVLSILNDPEIIYTKGTKNVSTEEPVVYIDKDGRYAMDDFGTSGIYLPAVDQNFKIASVKYISALESALEQMKAGEIKSFLKDYASVINDYSIISEVGYAVSALSDSGVPKSDITYDKICDYWHEGYIEEGMTDSMQWLIMNYYINRHPGGEEAVREWLAPYISQIADEVISPDNASVNIVEGSKGSTFIVKTEDIRKRLIDSVSLTYTAELPVVEEYWENSPIKEYRYDICPDLVLGQREAEVQIELKDGEDPVNALFNWFDDKSSVWEIDSVNDKWYALSDADGMLHVAAINEVSDEYTVAYALAYDEDGEEAPVELVFMNGDLKYVALYSSDLSYSVEFSTSDIDFELELMPVYLDQNTANHFMIPLSKSTFVLNAESADKIKLIFTDVANIPDIEDIDGDGSAITESLVITDIYKYSFDITDKLYAPADTLISITDADVMAASYDGTSKRPVVTYNGKILTEGVDYSISGSDNFVKAGCYEITVFGKGEYGGSMELSYEIVDPSDFATSEEFGNMSKTDYEKKTGKSVDAKAVRNTDGTVTVTIVDDNDNVLDVYTLDAKTGTGTDENGERVDLPQTGMSGIHKTITGLAAFMLLSGAVLIKKSRKENEE